MAKYLIVGDSVAGGEWGTVGEGPPSISNGTYKVVHEGLSHYLKKAGHEVTLDYQPAGSNHNSIINLKRYPPQHWDAIFFFWTGAIRSIRDITTLVKPEEKRDSHGEIYLDLPSIIDSEDKVQYGRVYDSDWSLDKLREIKEWCEHSALSILSKIPLPIQLIGGAEDIPNLAESYGLEVFCQSTMKMCYNIDTPEFMDTAPIKLFDNLNKECIDKIEEGMNFWHENRDLRNGGIDCHPNRECHKKLAQLVLERYS
tara:strand:+ start:73 stop:837 length:765 start_codon:yes stop_codon:yes gene_type:complete